jgi:hypothetical protein
MNQTAGMIGGTLVVLVYTMLAACGRWPDRLHADDRDRGRPDAHRLVGPTWPAAPARCSTRPRRRQVLEFLPERCFHEELVGFMAAGFTMMLRVDSAAGRVPARDVAKDEKTARAAPVIGGAALHPVRLRAHVHRGYARPWW